MYIKIIYNKATFGPLRASTTLRQILAALHIPSGANPSLHSAQNTTKIYTSDSLDVEVESGVYELIVGSGWVWVDSADEVGRDIINDVSSVRQTGTQTRDGDGRVDTEDQVKTERSTKLGQKPKTDNQPIQPKTEIETSIEALTHLLASIPARYTKYNATLSTHYTETLLELDRLQKTLQTLSSPSSSTPSSNPSKIPPQTLKLFTQYRLLTLLQNLHTKIFARYAPLSRMYSPTDFTSPHALLTAEHTLNNLHVWRRTLDAHTWESLKRSTTMRHLADSALIGRRGGKGKGVTKYFYIGGEEREKREREKRLYGSYGDRGTEPLQPWDYLSQGPIPFLPATPQDIPTLHIGVGPTTAEIRRLFIDVMRQTRLYRDEEMEAVLDELIKMDQDAKVGGKETSPVTSRRVIYPTASVKRAIMKEFRINTGI